MTRGVAAVAVSALPLSLMAQPASAFEVHSKFDIVEHTFTDFAGEKITCPISYGSELFRVDTQSPYFADASTQIGDGVSGGAGEACRAAVDVEIVYANLSGRRQVARSFGIELADLQIDEVLGNFEARHRAFFLNCASNCEAEFTTRPK